MKEILGEVLSEVDKDIKELFLKDSTQLRITEAGFYQNYELINDPIQKALLWQELRDRKQK